jgi:hypothetical protein
MKLTRLALPIALALLMAIPAVADKDHAERVLGKALVRSSGARVFIAIESLSSGSEVKSKVDHVFVLYLEAAPPQEIDLRLSLVSVIFSEDHLLLVSPNGPTRISFSTRKVAHSADEPAEEASFQQVPGARHQSISQLKIVNGVGLAHYKNLRPFTLDSLATSDLTSLKEGGLIDQAGVSSKDIGFPYGGGYYYGGGPQCPAGGPGSTSCSVSTCCSVSCGAGYYACCHCTDGCHCIKNSVLIE